MSEDNLVKLQADEQCGEVMQVARLLSAPAGKENDGVDVSDLQDQVPGGVEAQEEERTEGTVRFRIEQPDVPPPPKLPSAARPVEAAPLPASAPTGKARAPAKPRVPAARKAGGKSKDKDTASVVPKKPRAGAKGPTGKTLVVPARLPVVNSEDEQSGDDHSVDHEHSGDEEEEVMPTKVTEQPKVSAATAHYTTRYTTHYTTHYTTRYTYTVHYLF